MKRRIFIFIAVLCLSGLGIGTLTSSMPQPDKTVFSFKPAHWWWYDEGTEEWIQEEYYDIYYSVYNIQQGAYYPYNDGPFYPDPNPSVWSSESSNYLCAYNTQTYARIWVKKYSYSSWTLFGDIHMNTDNTTRYGGDVYQFNIVMWYEEEPIEEI